jgi:hypothetical protein
MHQERLQNRWFYKSPSFVRQTSQLDAWKQIDELKQRLAIDPMAGDVIKGTNGLRKIRIPLPGRGARGGGRVIYFQVIHPASILFLAVYAKNEQDDLDEDDRRALLRLRQAMCEKLELPL